MSELPLKNLMSREVNFPGILEARKRADSDFDLGLLSIVGPCSMSDDIELSKNENFVLSEASRLLPIGTVLHRIPPWKPRSDPSEWHGQETTNFQMAIDTITQLSRESGNIAIEIGKEEHIERYSRFLTMAWIGSRNFDNLQLQIDLVRTDTTLPVGIKNNLKCEIKALQDRTDQLSIDRWEAAELEGQLRNQGKIFPIFRGGPEIKTPEEWEKKFLECLDTFGRKFIVDVAHGGEMAHAPNRDFTKSEMGQLACIEHLLELCSRENIDKPCGIMIEASDAESQTDPVIPLGIGLETIRSFAES